MSNHRRTRRQLLSAGLIGLTAKAERPITGAFVDRSVELGHRLRDHQLHPAPKQTVRVPIVIAGGGMAGLCAAWRLLKRGFHDFVILEMESEAGGNSRSGKNEITGYPWAAHYVPVPSRENKLVRELMEDLGAFADGRWEERYLCHTPQERLYLHGRWQEGLEPELAITANDRAQYRRFRDLMHEFEASGEFVIPMETGKRRRADLDRLSMTAWMDAQHLDSPYLRWLVDYSCRDDYGSRMADTSAWAGIHYFAARGNQDDKGPLTWPEGNAWIANRLIARAQKQLRPNAMVLKIEPQGKRWRVLTPDTEYQAQVVIYAAPPFLLPYIAGNTVTPLNAQYSPWLTANLTLDRWPQERGAPIAWDNVIYRSPALGYVVATHQSLATHQERTVWTYYWALADGTPADNRRALLTRDWSYWKEAILTDLEQAHPDIRQCVSRVDIMRMGHAMVRPTPGYLFSPARESAARATGTFLLAHATVSGISIFEEAQFRGVQAANTALTRLG